MWKWKIVISQGGHIDFFQLSTIKGKWKMENGKWKSGRRPWWKIWPSIGLGEYMEMENLNLKGVTETFFQLQMGGGGGSTWKWKIGAVQGLRVSSLQMLGFLGK